MKKIEIKIDALKNIIPTKYPLYFRGQFNLANGYSGATKKLKIGSVTDIFKSFLKSNPIEKLTVENWMKYYTKRFPNTIQEATERNTVQLNKHIKALTNTDSQISDSAKVFLELWIRELIFLQTFDGLIIQNGIAKWVSKKTKLKLTEATDKEDSNNIDFYIDEKSVSVKPSTHNRGGYSANKTIIYEKSEKEGNIYIKTV